ncbi:hypothetical protein Y1Q_0010102 [Alligator mississippiensis]|uniref:Uncharacterized protein n=1 Tax=Alligator mississippiensis TaxID=8496 RepID=A0A151MGA5_ALLMI|nr:hypothetical protein Y1Q_0010102 [Alligator mississippiensis]
MALCPSGWATGTALIDGKASSNWSTWVPPPHGVKYKKSCGYTGFLLGWEILLGGVLGLGSLSGVGGGLHIRPGCDSG